MIQNYFTLQSWTKEVHPKLQGAVVQKCFSQIRNELNIAVDNGGQAFGITISTDPLLPKLFLGKSPHQKKQSVELFPNLKGIKISTIEMHPEDRIIFFRFERSDDTLLLERFGTRNNVLYVNKHYQILEAFKKNRELKNTIYLFRENGQYIHPLHDHFQDWYDRISVDPRSGAVPETAKKVLTKTIWSMTSRLADEILYRAGVEPTQPKLKLIEFERLYATLQEVYQQFSTPDPQIYWIHPEEIVFTLIPFRIFKNIKHQQFEETNEALKYYFLNKKITETFEERYSQISKSLHSTVERLLIKIKELESTLPREEDIAQAELKGGLILTHLKQIPKKARLVLLPDPTSSSLPDVKIHLDPDRTPPQNANDYFELAKRLRKQREKIPERIKLLTSEYQRTVRFQEQLEGIEEIKELKEFEKSIRNQTGAIRETPGEQPVALPYREFKSRDGKTIWVGRDAEDNDKLTFHLARKNDYWFHAQGVSGSHVLLRWSGEKTNPSHRLLIECAQLAAFYSKAKTSKYVPVAYTLCKYVRKPRGARPGTVIIEREKTIFAEPIKPEDD